MRVYVIRMNVDAISEEAAVACILSWVNDSMGRYVCVSNVHMCMEVFDSVNVFSAVDSADLTVADGKPIYIAQQVLGYREAQQIRGADLTRALCEQAETRSLSIGFFGATDELIVQLKKVLNDRFPALDIAYAFAPPFRSITEEEDAEHIRAINASGVSILFVGLGCPKQEVWMYEHRNKLNCVMIGVGAAFDFIAGNKKHAPQWMQRVGLEWLFRLISEPRRLWKRYLKHNPRFIWYFLQQLLGRDFSKRSSINR